jgi:AcrR family transcriptional regulator
MAPRQTSGRYGGVSAEERREERRAKLMVATLDIIGMQGLSAATVSAVSESAGLIRRYFYESFLDLETLLVALYEQVLAEAAVTVLRAIETVDADARRRARAGIAAFIQFISTDAGRARLVFVYAEGHPALSVRHRDAEALFVGMISEELKASYRIPAHSDDLVNFNARMLVGGSVATLISWLEDPSSVPQSELVERFVDFYVMVGNGIADSKK